MSTPAPVIHYTPADAALKILHASARIIEKDGRSGVHFTSIRGRAALPRHTAAAQRGSVTLWVLPLQEYFPAAQHQQHRASNPFYDRFVFLSDREAIQEIESANFSLYYHSYWHPVFIAKFAHGTIHDAVMNSRWGAATAGHFALHAHHWYQLGLTWDRDAGIYQIYANGVKVGHSDAFIDQPRPTDPPAPWLYFGSPAYAMGDIAFYDTVLDEEQMRSLHDAEADPAHPIVEELRRTYEGHQLPRFAHREPGADWRSELSLSLRQEEDYSHFFQQGAGPCLSFSGEGLRITTPSFEYNRTRRVKPLVGTELDMSRMYLWTRRMFEGDLHVSVDFKLHCHGGLALLMTHATGMQGEDFLEDYRLRTDGSMRVVCWEDVRNYHWEFYREIRDTRNDLVSHAMLKNPWYRPAAFQIEDRKWELDRWYRLTYLQEGSRLLGAIDDVQVIDYTDTGFDNNGPVLRHGHIALRCMMETDITFRDLRIHTRPHFSVTPLAQRE